MNSGVLHFNYEKKFELLIITVSVHEYDIQTWNSLLHAH